MREKIRLFKELLATFNSNLEEYGARRASFFGIPFGKSNLERLKEIQGDGQQQVAERNRMIENVNSYNKSNWFFKKLKENFTSVKNDMAVLEYFDIFKISDAIHNSMSGKIAGLIDDGIKTSIESFLGKIINFFAQSSAASDLYVALSPVKESTISFANTHKEWLESEVSHANKLNLIEDKIADNSSELQRQRENSGEIKKEIMSDLMPFMMELERLKAENKEKSVSPVDDSSSRSTIKVGG